MDVRAKPSHVDSEALDIFIGQHICDDFRSVTVDADLPHNVNVTYTAFLPKYTPYGPNRCLAKLAGFNYIGGDVLVIRRSSSSAKHFVNASEADIPLITLIMLESFF